MKRFELPDGCHIGFGSITAELIPAVPDFELLWDLHPNEYSKIMIHGRTVKVPRWDQAFEKDYPFANQVAKALRAPKSMTTFLKWAQENVDKRLNGLFVNWHDGAKGHYHGKHRDSTIGLIQETPIVTLSLGEERIFRLRPYPERKPPHDFLMNTGDVIVIPWITNQKWTHEIPKFVRYQGRRISITMRAFA